MDDSPYSRMARDFFDLWQKQCANAVNDKQFLQTMLDLVQSFQSPQTDGKSKKSAASHTSTASDDEHAMPAEFAFRLRMVEQRLADVEARLGKPKRAAGSRPKGSKKPRR